MNRTSMNHPSTEQFRRELLSRRSALQRRWRAELYEESELLAGHEPGWEDTPAARTLVSVHDRVNALERSALARIQNALSRIERGSYGECVICHDAIGEERLRAVPDADRCGPCAPSVN